MSDYLWAEPVSQPQSHPEPFFFLHTLQLLAECSLCQGVAKQLSLVCWDILGVTLPWWTLSTPHQPSGLPGFVPGFEWRPLFLLVPRAEIMVSVAYFGLH